MASIQEILESMRPDFQQLNSSISKVVEDIRALFIDMQKTNLEFKENLNSFALLVKEMGSEELERENGIAKVELQSEGGQATNLEPNDLVDSEECSEKFLILKNYYISNCHHSPLQLSRHRSDRKLDSKNTWVQCRKFKNPQLCVCRRKPQIFGMVICNFSTWVDGTIKIWDPGDSTIFIHYVWVCKETIRGQVIKNGTDPDMHVWVSLINFYAKCHTLDFAQKVFDEMPDRNIVNWTALIARFIAEGHGSDGVYLFREMRKEGMRPNEFTLATSLKDGSMSMDLKFGKQIHAEIIGKKKYFAFVLWGFNISILVCNRIFEGYRFSSIGQHWARLDNMRGTLRWHICFNFVTLRLISFGYDYHWACCSSCLDQKKHIQSCPKCSSGKTCYLLLQERNIQNNNFSYGVYLCYLVYSPLYIAGPIVSFNAFASQLDMPQNNYAVREVYWYGLRWVFILLLMELMTHLFYYNAFAISGLWKQLSPTPTDIFIIEYGVLNFMRLKFFLIWLYFRFWSLLFTASFGTNGVSSESNFFIHARWPLLFTSIKHVKHSIYWKWIRRKFVLKHTIHISTKFVWLLLGCHFCPPQSFKVNADCL